MNQAQHKTIDILVPERVNSGIVRNGAELRALVELIEIIHPVFVDSHLGMSLSDIPDAQHVLLPASLAEALGLLAKNEENRLAIAA